MGGEGSGDLFRGISSKLTKGIELSGIDRRTIGAVRTGGVHGPQARETEAQGRPRRAATRRLRSTTCRDIVGLVRSGEREEVQRCRRAGLSVHVVGFQGGGEGVLVCMVCLWVLWEASAGLACSCSCSVVVAVSRPVLWPVTSGKAAVIARYHRRVKRVPNEHVGSRGVLQRANHQHQHQYQYEYQCRIRTWCQWVAQRSE
jgi:hypothetical protein